MNNYKMIGGCFMTAYEIYDQIHNLAKDPKTGYHVVDELIQAYYYADRVPRVIVYIQEVFKCDEDTAKEVFEIFKKENAQDLLTPEQAAANQAACEMNRLVQQNKPKCPTCSSTNVQKIGTGERAVSVAMLGMFSKKINKSFKCKNCGYTW